MCVVIAALIACGLVRLEAQRGNPQPPRAPRAAAPIDLTGYWVSIVTQDWRWRMVTPAKGDYQGIQMTPEGRKIADAWDPAKDEAAGEQCKSYGAPALMSVPGRLHITWQDDTTIKVDADAGLQTRLLRFGNVQTPLDSPQAGGCAAHLAGRLGGPVAAGAPERAAAAQAGGSHRGRAATSADRRVAASRHQEPPRGIPAKERRSLQRERRADRALGSLQAAEW